MAKQKPVLETSEKPKARVGDGTPGPGRPKGLKNAMTVQVKEMILAALNGAGGVEYLIRQADETPAAFLSLVGKVLPLTLQGNPDQPLVVQQVKDDADALERGIARLAAGMRSAAVARESIN